MSIGMLRRTIFEKSTAIFLSMSAMTLVFSCSPSSQQTRAFHTAPGAQKYRSFSLIRALSQGTVTTHRVSGGPDSCNEEPKELDGVETLVSRRSTGSGVVVAHIRGMTYVMTAHHVCVIDDLERSLEVFGPDEGQLTSSQVSWQTSHTAIDIRGRRHEAEIVQTDRANDLCVLKTRGTWGEVARVSEQEPELGEVVFGISAPTGLFSPYMVPIFMGIHSGSSTHISSDDEEPFLHMTQSHIYTFSSSPGSSGAGVFNYRGELIGIVTGVMQGVEGLSVASSRDSVHDALDQLIHRVSAGR